MARLTRPSHPDGAPITPSPSLPSSSQDRPSRAPDNHTDIGAARYPSLAPDDRNIGAARASRDLDGAPSSVGSSPTLASPANNTLAELQAPYASSNNKFYNGVEGEFDPPPSSSGGDIAPSSSGGDIGLPRDGGGHKPTLHSPSSSPTHYYCQYCPTQTMGGGSKYVPVHLQGTSTMRNMGGNKSPTPPPIGGGGGPTHAIDKEAAPTNGGDSPRMILPPRTWWENNASNAINELRDTGLLSELTKRMYAPFSDIQPILAIIDRHNLPFITDIHNPQLTATIPILRAMSYVVISHKMARNMQSRMQCPNIGEYEFGIELAIKLLSVARQVVSQAPDRDCVTSALKDAQLQIEATQGMITRMYGSDGCGGNLSEYRAFAACKARRIQTWYRRIHRARNIDEAGRKLAAAAAQQSRPYRRGDFFRRLPTQKRKVGAAIIIQRWSRKTLVQRRWREAQRSLRKCCEELASFSTSIAALANANDLMADSLVSEIASISESFDRIHDRMEAEERICAEERIAAQERPVEAAMDPPAITSATVIASVSSDIVSDDTDAPPTTGKRRRRHHRRRRGGRSSTRPAPPSSPPPPTQHESYSQVVKKSILEHEQNVLENKIRSSKPSSSKRRRRRRRYSHHRDTPSHAQPSAVPLPYYRCCPCRQFKMHMQDGRNQKAVRARFFDSPPPSGIAPLATQ